jgi:hypothetical protein
MNFLQPLKKYLIASLLICTALRGQDSSQLLADFESAAAEFNVPSDVLKGIAFAETRWQHLTWAAGDTANCMGMPHPYGIMSLWDNDFFGHTLREAAALIGKSPEVLKMDVVENIRGAAALLQRYHAQLPLPDGTSANDIESWRNAIAAYSGIPQPELAQQHALDIYTQMSVGYHQYHISWDARPVNLQPIRDAVAQIQKKALETKSSRSLPQTKRTNTPDYPLAKWAQAYPDHWYTTGYQKNFVVIHDMEGYYLSTISYFQLSSTQASIYYDVNSARENTSDAPLGEVTQQVEERYWAWHVICWNRYMLGIEHEGFYNQTGWYTDEMYRASAKLTAYMCAKYKIPVDRNHIIGHQEWQNSSWVNWINTVYNPQLLQQGLPTFDPTCNSHIDPGPNWNWPYYMNLVDSYLLPPTVVSASPQPAQSNVRLYKPIVIKFSTPMDSATTINALSVAPSLAKSVSWNSDYTTLTLQPASLLVPSTSYAVKVDTSAKSRLLTRSFDGNGDGIPGDPYQYNFTTEAANSAPLSIIQTFPKPNAQGVSIYADLSLRFSFPLSSSTVTGHVSIQDAVGNTVSISNLTVDSLNEQGWIFSTPSQLIPNRTYRIIAVAGIKDLYGHVTSRDTSIQFTTSGLVVTPGITLESFDSNTRSWQQPTSNTGSALFDSLATSFAIVTEKKLVGTASGKLAYRFTQSKSGVIDLTALGRPTLDPYNTLSIWVYGDESGNRLEAVFQPANQKFSLGTIDWRGWKFFSITLGALTGPGRQLTDFIVRQADSAAMSGRLYFDDIQLNATITGITQHAGAAPLLYQLGQNFPNPFNPTTTIGFEVPFRTHLKLTVFDVLGQEVATIANGEYEAGIYRLAWNASSMPSGVYFYRIEASGYVNTQKMVLMK